MVLQNADAWIKIEIKCPLNRVFNDASYIWVFGR